MMTEIALRDDLLLRVEKTNLVGARGLAVLASDTAVWVHQDDAVFALIGCFHRADRNADRVFALVAVDRNVAAPNKRESTLFHGFHPRAKHAQGHVVFSLAGHRTALTPDTAIRVNDHGPTDVVVSH
jgi:hypothetical protein